MQNYTFSLLIAATLLLVSGKGKFEPSKSNCLGLDKDIKVILSKMRAGYNAKQGERYKTKLKQLKSDRYKCKHKGFEVT